MIAQLALIQSPPRQIRLGVQCADTAKADLRNAKCSQLSI